MSTFGAADVTAYFLNCAYNLPKYRLEEPKMAARIFGPFCLFACICVCMGPGVAQTPADHPRFAIEFPGFNGPFPAYVTIPEAASPNSSSCSSFSYGHSLTPLANVGAGIEQPSALQLEICVKGDAIFITPTVFYGASDRQNPPALLEKLRHQTLQNHSVKQHDSVTFPEMEQVGLQPLTLRIVSAQPDSPYHPLTRTDVPSVQIDYAPVDRTDGMVILRNLSNKAVDAFRIGNFQEAGSGEESSLEEYKSNGLSAVIAPGSSHQTRIGIEHSGKTVNGTFIEDPQPQYMVLQSVLFAGGSYEGDAQSAAEMAARVFGAQVQLVRIERLAESILADDGLDDEAKIERIRAAIQQLSTQADAEKIAQFHAQFANFPEDLLTHAERIVGLAMKDENESMGHLFQENEPMFLQHRSRLTLAQWWAAIILRNPS
jgi:anti-sigma28 factor (negative regulator of flagellin synthesis)